jgi:outer membrane lipoprotein SlyB
MRKLLAVLVVASPLTLLPAIGSAKGCLKGAAVGGVVGHVAGHHAVVGAAAGCVIEHHREKAKDKAAQQNRTVPQGKTAPQDKAAVPQNKAPAADTPAGDYVPPGSSLKIRPSAESVVT